MPRVSVVMAVYNAAPYLREAVDSVLAQTLADFELIAVDDASSDESLSILESYADPRLRIFRHRVNKGAACSRNTALEAATAEYVAIMDSDDVCETARLDRQAEFLDRSPEAGLVGCAVFDNIDVRGEVLYTSYLPEEDAEIQRELVKRWCFLHPSIMFRRDLYLRVGGYRAAFEPAEDHDFILRILEHCQAHNLRERLVRYRLNPKGLSVVGHRYINELGELAMRVAKRRRSGQPEDFETEIASLLEQKHVRSARNGVFHTLHPFRDSFYAADRYYGFGCRELCAGKLERARRCYLRSLRTNCFFVKSWVGMILSLSPFAASRLKPVFQKSMRQQVDHG